MLICRKCFFRPYRLTDKLLGDLMRCPKLLVRAVLFFTIPALTLYPQTDVYTVETSKQMLDNLHLWTYDDILGFMDRIEYGELDCTQSDLIRINQFLARLAKEGVVPGDPQEAEILEDIQELLEEQDYSYENTRSLAHTYDYVIIPTIYRGKIDSILCRGWVGRSVHQTGKFMSTKCHQTKKFVKKHKKPIIIGAAVVVVAVTVVTVVGAVAAASAASAAVVAVSNEEKPKDKHSENYSNETSPSEGFPVESMIEERVSTFKETLAEDNYADACANKYEELSFGEKVRNLASDLAHQVFDEIFGLTRQGAEFKDEIKTIGQKILPEAIFSSDLSEHSNLEECGKNMVTGHERIDRVFSTDQSWQYTPEGKASKMQIETGVIPFPGGLFKAQNVSKVREILKAGQETAAVAQELGFTHQEITHLKKAGELERAVSNTFEKIVGNQVVKLEKQISGWLGEGAQVMHNKAGDPIFLSKDGLRKVRFDFNRPAPHENPHLHLERLIEGEWQEISRVYPIDVPHK